MHFKVMVQISVPTQSIIKGVAHYVFHMWTLFGSALYVTICSCHILLQSTFVPRWELTIVSFNFLSFSFGLRELLILPGMSLQRCFTCCYYFTFQGFRLQELLTISNNNVLFQINSVLTLEFFCVRYVNIEFELSYFPFMGFFTGIFIVVFCNGYFVIVS